MKNHLNNLYKVYSIILIGTSIFLTQKIDAQNIINPYKDWAANPNDPPPHYPPNGTVIIYDTDPGALTDVNGAWTGEYQTCLRDHFWNSNTPGINGTPRTDYVKSYIMETVSFPFMPSCAFTTGCTDPTGTTIPTPRVLSLPTDPYSNGKWGDLSKYTVEIPFNNSDDNGLLTSFYTLVSKSFVQYSPLDPVTNNREFLPHSILKHTIRIHCNGFQFNDIAYELSFIYDNTRGRMKWYPFSMNNYGTNGDGTYDVILRPVLHIRPETFPNPSSFTINYNENTNDDWFDNGTIPYYGCSEISNICSTGSPDCNNDHFVDYNATFGYIPIYDNIYPSPYSLLSGLLFGSGHADVLAGYLYNTVGSPHYEYKGAHSGISTDIDKLQHHYIIDQDFDITLINPTEKIFYNPSEVDIATPDLHFPNYYTFKTVLGEFPTYVQVTTQNTSANGGPYSDLRQVPVRTDVRYDGLLSYPSDPATDQNSVYASIYNIKDDAKLTIDQCGVKIFDASFVVDAGGTMAFADYREVYGKEDKAGMSTPGRYKIIGNGGAILRNYSGVQYVQNGDITQTYPLEYVALSQIHAGNNVDTDSDQPDGNYEIHSGAYVTFRAGNYVHLTNGFNVQGGNFHAFISDPIDLPDPCDQNINGRLGSPNKVSSQKEPSLLKLTIYPNPSTNNIIVSTSVFTGFCSLFITDVMGKQIYRASGNLKNGKAQVDVSSFPAGLYSVKIFNEDQFVSASFVKE